MRADGPDRVEPPPRPQASRSPEGLLKRWGHSVQSAAAAAFSDSVQSLLAALLEGGSGGDSTGATETSASHRVWCLTVGLAIT
jgi:hypothetical protein